MKTYRTNDFFFDGDKTFTCDASDIQFAPCEGFYLQSHKTGNLVWCKYESTQRDDEGDVVAWVYRSHMSRDRDPNTNVNFSVRIFND